METTRSARSTMAGTRSKGVRLGPWWTTTRRPGTNRRASLAQLPTTAGGAATSDGPLPRVR